jgi:oxygen-independent coproporphyrinogen-3 oxidase
MTGSLPTPIGLYVHVPFCVSKCDYCDFASYAARESDIPPYIEALVREIARRGVETGHPSADTIFLGGGTPSLLDPAQITRIFDALREAFSIAADAEITSECNPGTLTPALARALFAAGVNRLSLGVQAAQAHLLQLLGRIHHWEHVADSVNIVHEAGVENINLDLMFGLPSQTVADFRETLAAALALKPTHLSCYGLIVEEGTPLARDIAAGKLALPEEETEREMYELARQTLADHGFRQYEISNFAREGCDCRHNLGCWNRVPYLGFGCAAHSFYDDCRTMNPSRLDAYLDGEPPQIERITKEEARFESLMLGLRMTDGVKDEDFLRMHGLSIREAFGDKLKEPLAAGLLEWHNGALRLTRLGMDLQNTVLVDLL